MKILFDHQTFTYQPWGGISRLFCELIREFSSLGDTTTCVSLRYSSNDYLAEYGLSDHRELLPSVHGNWKTALVRVLNQVQSGRLIRCQDYDVLHPTYYDPYFLRHLRGKPYVLTVFDMTPERTGLGLSLLEGLVTRKELLIRKAARIIAISENTKRDIEELCGIPPERIDVVPLATSLRQTSISSDMHCALPHRYILYVGGRKVYKNFRLFAQAISPLLRNTPNLSLLCAGGGALNRAEERLLARLRIRSQVSQIPFRNDATLAHLYTNAIGFIFPSLYEGFGIPVLEAFACNCPVAASRAGSLPEVAGDAAVFFDPHSEEDIGRAVTALHEDGTLRENLREAGRARLKLFSWKKTAELTLQSYQNMLES